MGISRHRVSVRPSACRSVRLSYAGIVSKRLNVGLRKQRYVIAQGFNFFLMPTVVGGRRLMFPEICAQSKPPPFGQQFRPISAHSASTM